MSSLQRTLRRLVVRYSIRNRTRKAALISEWMVAHNCRTVMLVGSSGAEDTNANENIVENAISRQFDIVMAVNITQRSTPWPFTVADGRDLPFADRWVDFILANAIIEHVGAEADQRQFVSEQTRVGRCWAITTPNKWFPIESHTSAFLRHWSPSWRAQRDEFTRLLSLREFRDLLPQGSRLIGKPWSATFTALWDGDAPSGAG